MTIEPSAPAPTPVATEPVAQAPQGAPPAPNRAAAWPNRWLVGAAALAVLLAIAAITLSWNTVQRLRAAEQELTRRQQDAGSQAVEARTLARQAEAGARDAAAKVALLEGRVAENALYRSQLEELLQSLSRSRDENVLADVDAALRVAMQQSAITGSVEPLAAALRQADERMARYQQPRLERVRRAVRQDLEAVRSAAGVDLPTLTLRIDEIIRVVDELPLVAAATRNGGRREPSAVRARGADPASPASAPASAPPSGPVGVLDVMARHVWEEVRALVRVTRIDHPEAALVAPEQAFFLRENLKLRLLNARLAILSRQFDTAQADLREAQGMLDRYFDKSSRRVALAADALRQIGAQARQVVVPRPDATLAAVAAAAAGR